MKELPVLMKKILNFLNVCGPYVIMLSVNFGYGMKYNLLQYIIKTF